MKNKTKFLLSLMSILVFSVFLNSILPVLAQDVPVVEKVVEEIPLPQEPKIVLSKTSVYNTEKQHLTYTINWKVEGADVDSLVITDTLPAWTGGAISSISVQPNPVLAPGDLSFDPNNPTENREIRWDLGPKEAGTSGSITFRVEIWAKDVCEVDGNTVTAVATYEEEGTVEATASSEKISVKDPHCDVPEIPTATISAVKIVCDSEDDLPNWGIGGNDITTTTATDFLAADLAKDEKQDCHLDDWKFQWAPSSAVNPGDNVNQAGEPWTTFNTETPTTVPSGSKIWVREQAKETYIPFSGATTNLDDVASKNSAEFYCSNDVLNYDNYDFIDPVETGKTYYCVGFNVLKEDPISCNAEASQAVVSDNNTQVDVHDALALSFIHPGWTASIPGATWIWATDPVESPANDADLTKRFTRTFSIIGTPTGGTLDIAADNHYTAKVNGNLLPVVFDENNFQLGTQDSYDISSYLVSGSNTLEIEVTNKEIGESGDPAANPAGLIYKLSLTNNECEVPPTENLAPIANAGTDQTITLPVSSSSLDGSASTDSDGTIVSYVWTFVSGPSTIDPSDVVSPNISGLVQGTYVFELAVTDNDGATDNDTVSITISPEIPGDNNDNDNSSRSSSSGGSRRIAKSPGQVLGAETSVCTFAIDTYMRKGYQNNKNQVVILQNLLNKYVGTKLTPDGDYGDATEAAVKAFQVKYGDTILKPWNLTSPTGIFYKTTLVQAKNLECPETILPIPAPLINWSRNKDEVPTKVR